MTLAARIAVGPSRVVARAERVVLAGGLAAAGACALVRVLPASIAIGAACIVALAAALVTAARPWTLRGAATLVIGPTRDIDVVDAAGGVRAMVLAEGSLVVPGLSIVRVVPAAHAETGRADAWVMVDGEVLDTGLGRDGAWRLRRFLTWHAHAGRHTVSRNDRPSR